MIALDLYTHRNRLLESYTTQGVDYKSWIPWKADVLILLDFLVYSWLYSSSICLCTCVNSCINRGKEPTPRSSKKWYLCGCCWYWATTCTSWWVGKMYTLQTLWHMARSNDCKMALYIMHTSCNSVLNHSSVTFYPWRRAVDIITVTQYHSSSACVHVMVYSFSTWKWSVPICTVSQYSSLVPPLRGAHGCCCDLEPP